MSLCPYHLGGICYSGGALSFPFLLLVAAFSAASRATGCGWSRATQWLCATSGSQKSNQPSWLAWASGRRLGITCREAGLIELITAADWSCLSNTAQQNSCFLYWQAVVTQLLCHSLFSLLLTLIGNQTFWAESSIAACISWLLRLCWQPYPADIKAVRSGQSDEGSSWGCLGWQRGGPLEKSNQMLIRLKWPPSDALGSRWEAGTVPRGQVGCTYASLLF